MNSKKFLLALWLSVFGILPMLASAQAFPDFPMSLSGAVLIDGHPAPVGSVAHAYYGTALAGEFVVDTAGRYGSVDPYAPQFLVKSGSGPISFGLILPPTSGAKEILSPARSQQFSAGAIIQIDLSFTSPAPIAASGGGGGGGGGGSSGGGGGSSGTVASSIPAPITANVPKPIDTPAPTPSAVCEKYLTKRLSYGGNNDSDDVRKLQTFLNREVNETLPVTGVFGPLTKAAVMRFQEKYRAQILGSMNPTGFVYEKTLDQINRITCTSATLSASAVVGEVAGAHTEYVAPVGVSALTREQIMTIIAKLIDLLAQLKSLRGY